MSPSTDTDVWVSVSSSADNGVASSGVIQTQSPSPPTQAQRRNRGPELPVHGLRELKSELRQPDPAPAGRAGKIPRLSNTGA